MDKHRIYEKRKMRKLFPWLKAFLSKYAEKFLDDNEEQALEYLLLNVNAEIKALNENPNEKKASELFNLLNTIFLHLSWKMNWKSFKKWKSYWKKAESPSVNSNHVQEKCYTKLLYCLLNLSIILTNGNKESEWISRILTIFKIMPSLLNASYGALLLVNDLRKKYSRIYSLILKGVLVSSTIKHEDNCLLYSKIVLLFRRLLKPSTTEIERKEILATALKVNPPTNFLSWLSSINNNNGEHLRTENIMEHLLSRTYPDELLRKLHKIVIPEERDYQKVWDSNIADHSDNEELSCSSFQESKSTFSENFNLNETEESQMGGKLKKKKKVKDTEIRRERENSKEKKSKHHKADSNFENEDFIGVKQKEQVKNYTNNENFGKDKLIFNSDLESESCLSQADCLLFSNKHQNSDNISEVKVQEEESLENSDNNAFGMSLPCFKRNEKVKHKKKKNKKLSKRNLEREVKKNMETKNHKYPKMADHDSNEQIVTNDSIISNSLNLERCFSQIDIREKDSDEFLKKYSKNNNVELETDLPDVINMNKKIKKRKSAKKSKKKNKHVKKKKDKTPTTEKSKHKKKKKKKLSKKDLKGDDKEMSKPKKHKNPKVTNNDSDEQIVTNDTIISNSSNLEFCFSQINKSANLTSETDFSDDINEHKKSRKSEKIKDSNKEFETAEKKNDEFQTSEAQLSDCHSDNKICDIADDEKLNNSKTTKFETNMLIKNSIAQLENEIKTKDDINDTKSNSSREGLKNKINSKCKMKKLFNIESTVLKSKDSILPHSLDNGDSPHGESLSNSSPNSNQTLCSDVSISELLKFPKISIYRNNEALGIKKDLKIKNKEISKRTSSSDTSVKNSQVKYHKKRKIDTNFNAQSSEETNGSVFSSNELIVASKNILVQTQSSEICGSQNLFEEDINSVHLNEQTQSKCKAFNNNMSCNESVKNYLESDSLEFSSKQPSQSLISASVFKTYNSNISTKSSTSSVFSLSSSIAVSPSNSVQFNETLNSVVRSVKTKNTQNYCTSKSSTNFLSKPNLFLPYVVLDDVKKTFSKSSSSTLDLQSNISSQVNENSCSLSNSVSSLCQAQLTPNVELEKTKSSPSSVSETHSLLLPSCSETTFNKIRTFLPSYAENENTETVPCLIPNVTKSNNEDDYNSFTCVDNNQGNSIFTAENTSIASVISQMSSKEYLSSTFLPAPSIPNDEESSAQNTVIYQSDQNSLFSESETDSRNVICNNNNEEYQSDINVVNSNCLKSIGTNTEFIDLSNCSVDCRIINNNNAQPLANVPTLQIIINLDNQSDHPLLHKSQMITNINFHSASNSYESPVIRSNVLLNQDKSSQTAQSPNSNIELCNPSILCNEGSQVGAKSDINLQRLESIQYIPMSTNDSLQKPKLYTSQNSNYENSVNLNDSVALNSYIYDDLNIINNQTNFYENSDTLLYGNNDNLTGNIKLSSTVKSAAQTSDSFSKSPNHDSSSFRTGTEIYSSSDELSELSLSPIYFKSGIETELSVGENILISVETKENSKNKLQTNNNKKQAKFISSSKKSSEPKRRKKAPPRKRAKSGITKSKKVKSMFCLKGKMSLVNDTIKSVTDAEENKNSTNVRQPSNSRYNFRVRGSLRKPNSLKEYV